MPSDVLTAREAERFLREAFADARDGRTDEAIHRAADELAEMKIAATVWRMWQEGRVRAGFTEDGELRWHAKD